MKSQVLSGGVLSPEVQSVVLAEPTCRQFVDTVSAQGRVLLGQAGQDLTGLVYGAVVDHDDLKVAIVQRQLRLQSRLDGVDLIAGRYDDRYLGSGCLGRQGRTS